MSKEFADWWENTHPHGGNDKALAEAAWNESKRQLALESARRKLSQAEGPLREMLKELGSVGMEKMELSLDKAENLLIKFQWDGAANE